MAVRNECACGKELGTGPPCPMGHTKAPGRRVPGSVSTGTTRPNTSLRTGEPRAAGPRAWLGACVTPRPPGALGDHSGQHAPLSPRGLVPFALFQLAFGQGAGRVDHGGQEDGKARLLPAGAPSSSGHLGADAALVEGHSSRPWAFPRQLPLPPFPVGPLGSAPARVWPVLHPADGAVVDNGPRRPSVRRYVLPSHFLPRGMSKTTKLNHLTTSPVKRRSLCNGGFGTRSDRHTRAVPGRNATRDGDAKTDASRNWN